MGGASSHDIEDGILDMDDTSWWEKYVRLAAEGRCQFRRWFLGHYHQNRTFDDRFIALWERIVALDWEDK